MNFNFGEILTRAWQIIWKHKVLWIFGILAGCGQGGGNGGGNSGGGGGDATGFGQPPNLPPEMMDLFRWIEENLLTFIILTCAAILLIWLVTIAIGAIGKIGLIRGAAQAEGGAEKLIFGQLFSEGMPYFWRMFGLAFVRMLPILLVFAAILAIAVPSLLGPLTSNGDAPPEFGFLAMGPLLLGCICLLIPVLIVLNLIINQSERAVVFEELSVMPAISRGWEVLRQNLGAIILMAIILFVISFVLGIVIAIPFILIVFPVLFAILIAGETQSFTPLYLMAICFCIYIPIAWLLQGVITAYTEVAWTLTYMRLTDKPQDNAPIALEANA